jgi:CRISPR-associated protein Cmr2
MTYLALTIGPIYKTLSSAKKTRELWGGSYLFSYVMREIISDFKEREFIVPYIKDKSIFDSGREVGLFHDRFIFEALVGDKELLEKRVTLVIENLAKQTKLDLAFINDYLQIHIVEKDLDEKSNPILELTPYLYTAELFYSLGQYKENKLSKMLTTNNSFLTKDAFGEKKSFPSLPEIAMHDIDAVNVKSLLKDDELEVYDNSELKPHLKPYHKYYAIVHADGDSMGKVVESLKNKEDFQGFSKKLFEYCITSHKLISDFGGETIFAGGDDLLFFAPVVSGDKTIFELCDEISKDFNESFKAEATLSFGVSIQYYKFPLYEALKKSRDLLFDYKKGAKSGNKNNIAFSVTKHSGQTFSAVIHKGDKELYENFKLFSSNTKGGEGLDNFLGSLHHKLDAHKTVLSHIGEDKERLEAFFQNYFNKDEHIQYADIFAQMVEFMYEAYKSNDKDKALETVYATLRFVKFIQGDKA